MEISTLKQLLKSRYVFLLTIILAFGLGYLISPRETMVAESTSHDHSGKADTWTCSMHPQIKLSEPGQCPICFMDLIPLETSPSAESPLELTLSERAMKLAEVMTMSVRRGPAQTEIRLAGKIDYDETRVKTISAWIPGRLERLFVDYTGSPVNAGEHLFEIYSPELYVAQSELIQVLRDLSDPVKGLPADSYNATLKATRRKLAYLGMTSQQIAELEQRGTPGDRITITSPLSGVVIHKNAVEGRYVETGTPIYTVADLSRVWLILDAYESDLPYLKFGQELEFTTAAIPGESFSGRITFIDPTLDENTRTVKVRVNLANPERKLKPGMFASAVVLADLDAGGQAINPDLAGKWICPMHPEVISAEPGTCAVCGMDLVPTSDLGIVNAPKGEQLPRLVPASAVLETGKRAVVYVEIPGREQPTFVLREVTPGPRVGADYIVLSGLAEGERVVTNGNFKIDSAMQLAAKPSMMNPAETGQMHQHHSGMAANEMREKPGIDQRLEPLLEAVNLAGKALQINDLSTVREALSAVRFMEGKFDTAGLPAMEKSRWEQAQMELAELSEQPADLPEARLVQERIAGILRQLSMEEHSSHE